MHWIPVRGFDNYEVNEYGDIRNANTGRIIIPYVNRQTGYPIVRLYRNGKQVTRTVHRLVADSFYDGDHTGREVNHIDGNKLNNCLGNLEWCSRSENARHAIETGLFKPHYLPPRYGEGIKVKIVETGEVFNTITECARHVGGFKTAISACLKGKVKTHMGYHYEIVD